MLRTPKFLDTRHLCISRLLSPSKSQMNSRSLELLILAAASPEVVAGKNSGYDDSGRRYR
jgi:hypothetical protein